RRPARGPLPAGRDSSAPYWRGRAPAKPRARRGPGGSCSRARTRSWSSALTEGKATDYRQLAPPRTAARGEWQFAAQGAVSGRVLSSARFSGNRRAFIMSNRQPTKEHFMGQWYHFLIDWLTQHPQWLGLILLI